MSTYWNNLRPIEKRMMVGFGVVLFIIVNFLFVFPHFSDLAAMRGRLEEAQKKAARWEGEIAKTNLYVIELRKFEKDAGDVTPEEQGSQFANAVQSQAGQSGVRVLSNSKINTQTNQFFLEKSQSVGVEAEEQQLVDFLYSLGSGNTQIRARELSLRPDPPRQRLVANVKLVASYQKKPTVRPVKNPAALPKPDGFPDKTANTSTKRP